ncbi:hypothetical protein BDW71DRAFT_204825 [Aspergillus fruticulosus]
MSMEINFDPNICLQSTFYHVSGYESDLHALTSPTPPFPGWDTLSRTSDAFKREQILQSEAYYERSPVVLVHGMVVASSYLHDLGRHLAPWFRVFIPDLPGFGRSSEAIKKNDKVSISQLAQGLHDWMDTAGIRKAHFVSNSLGCQILAEFTHRWPDRVDRLVLQGPTMDKSRRPILTTLLALAANSTNEPLSMTAIMIRDYWRAGLRRAFALFRETTDYRILDVLKHLKTPTLLLSCELDPVTPCSWVAELSNNMPNAVHYVLKETGHTANYSATEKMSRVTLRFLLIQDDERIGSAGREILEKVTEINQTREAAKRQRSQLIWGQSVLGLIAVLAMWKGLVGRWGFSTVLLAVEFMILYRYCKIRPLLSLGRSDHLDRVYIKLQGIADFDSASSMLRAIGRHLHFRDFPQLGIPTPLAAAMPLTNWLPSYLRDTVYSAVGANEATEDISSTFDAESITQSIVAHFPAHQKYPAVAIGSTNGALTHLYAAMGIPWLPQTLLMPVKRPKHAAIKQGQLDMTAEMEWGRHAAQTLLEMNPGIELCHMADPNQDQLMIRRMAYFRLKFIQMTQAYRNFLLDALEAKGTIIIVRCGLKWPSTKVADRHYFQSGAVGGLSAEEFIHGSTAVNEFVNSQKSPFITMRESVMGEEHKTNWNAPPSDCEVPEAEWGYSERLTDDIVQFAKEHGFHIKYLDYGHPENASPLVADAYRQWKEQLRRTTDSILVESFIVMEPWLSIRYNLTPFWTVFPVKPSLERLQGYLKTCHGKGKAFRDGFMFLFCSGLDSIGLAGIHEWKRLLESHFASQDIRRESGRDTKLLLGTDEKAFPKDFGFPARYQTELARAVGKEAQYVMPPNLPLGEFEHYMMQNADRYKHGFAKIEIKAYMVEDLQPNMLVGTEVLVRESFVFGFENLRASIGSFQLLTFPIQCVLKRNRVENALATPSNGEGSSSTNPSSPPTPYVEIYGYEDGTDDEMPRDPVFYGKSGEDVDRFFNRIRIHWMGKTLLEEDRNLAIATKTLAVDGIKDSVTRKVLLGHIGANHHADNPVSHQAQLKTEAFRPNLISLKTQLSEMRRSNLWTSVMNIKGELFPVTVEENNGEGLRRTAYYAELDTRLNLLSVTEGTAAITTHLVRCSP